MLEQRTQVIYSVTVEWLLQYNIEYQLKALCACKLPLVEKIVRTSNKPTFGLRYATCPKFNTLQHDNNCKTYIWIDDPVLARQARPAANPITAYLISTASKKRKLDNNLPEHTTTQTLLPTSQSIKKTDTQCRRLLSIKRAKMAQFQQAIKQTQTAV